MVKHRQQGYQEHFGFYIYKQLLLNVISGIRLHHQKRKKDGFNTFWRFFQRHGTCCSPCIILHFITTLLTWTQLSGSQPGVEVVASGDELLPHVALWRYNSSVTNKLWGVLYKKYKRKGAMHISTEFNELYLFIYFN